MIAARASLAGHAAVGDRSAPVSDLSVALDPSPACPNLIRLAESLGFSRAWVVDMPAHGTDVWACLAVAAEKTTTIRLGAMGLVPTLRHPIVDASAATAVASAAPGRLAVGFGNGIEVRRAMGQPAVPWPDIVRHVETFRELVQGNVAEWDGAALRLCSGEGAARPEADIEIHLGAWGPDGMRSTRRLADGLVLDSAVPPGIAAFGHVALLVAGTVLAEHEDLHSPRVRAAVGPGVARTLHAAYATLGPTLVDALPGGPAWLDVVQQSPVGLRHIAAHAGHGAFLNEADVAAWSAGSSALATWTTVTGGADDVRARVAEYAKLGVTEVVHRPAGDIPRELNAMAAALGVAPA